MAICSGFSHEKLPFSIAILNYQRVTQLENSIKTQANAFERGNTLDPESKFWESIQWTLCDILWSFLYTKSLRDNYWVF